MERCWQMSDPDPRLDGLVRRLADADAEQRRAAVEELRGLEETLLLPSDARFLLEAAANEYPPAKSAIRSTSAELIGVAASGADVSCIPIVKEIFPFLQPDARGEALRLLAGVDDESGALALLDLLEAAVASGSAPELSLSSLERSPKFPDVYFPRMFRSARGDAAPAVFALCFAYAATGALSPRALAKQASFVVDAYRSLREKLRAAEAKDTIGWTWDEDYAFARGYAGLLLDLMGYFPAAEVEPILEEATRSGDPKLALFAAIALVRLGRPVGLDLLERVAASAETRSLLFDELKRERQPALFPRKWATQAALAESEMVKWLAYPTELGRPPDEIELMKVVSQDLGPVDGVMEWYVFRFRTHPPHWSSSKGWMAGIAGAFKKAGAPSTTAYGDTFSTMAPWESMTPEQHLAAIRELMTKWRKRASRD
jgi:hypothetical protein